MKRIIGNTQQHLSNYCVLCSVYIVLSVWSFLIYQLYFYLSFCYLFFSPKPFHLSSVFYLWLMLHLSFVLGARRCEDGCRPSTPWSTCVSTHSPTLTFSMNGDMPHVPITTLAGIASLTDCECHTAVFSEYCYSFCICFWMPGWITASEPIYTHVHICLFYLLLLICLSFFSLFHNQPKSLLKYFSSHHSVEPAAPPLPSTCHHH